MGVLLLKVEAAATAADSGMLLGGMQGSGTNGKGTLTLRADNQLMVNASSTTTTTISTNVATFHTTQTTIAVSADSMKHFKAALEKVFSAVIEREESKPLEECLHKVYTQCEALNASWLPEITQELDKTIRVLSQHSISATKSKSSDKGATSVAAVGTETAHLQEYAERIPGDLEQLSSEEIEQLDWRCGEPINQAPWAEFPAHVTVYRSAKLTEYVVEALKHVVQGDQEHKMGMTQGELFDEICENCPGIGIWIIGGFVRDAVQGKPGKGV